ncbi:uncharacterized protein TNCT_164881 [Trichonephila clavata]|uniref:Uncharacterized protein n=1 Tax=Trichonephila clavata TaxID=2740835 RepID=A0A8X6GU70_TRICU|nr:uncharacterized protein TNCT_164881 [Trichonephila clavata]
MVLDHFPVLSLKELCLVKIAIVISNDGEVKTYLQKHLPRHKTNIKRILSWPPPNCFRWGDHHPALVPNEGYVMDDDGPFDEEDNGCDCLLHYTSQFEKNPIKDSRLQNRILDYMKWKSFITKKLSSIFLPHSLEKDLLAFICRISLEARNWVKAHAEILRSSVDLFSSNLQWKSHGKINKEQTAKSLIRNMELSIRERYALASFYCFKDEALKLWNKMTWGEKYLVGYDYPSLGVWNKWMKGVSAIDWDILADYTLWRAPHDLPRNRLWKFFFFLGVRSSFTKLSQEKKLQWLDNCFKEEIYDLDEFHFCLSYLDAHEKENIFKKYPFHVLLYFLDWPLQDEFLEVADLMWSYLTERMFFHVLHFIIYEKIIREWSEYNYFYLLKKFWYGSPIHLKECIQSKKIYEALMIAIHCQNQSTFHNELVVKFCADFDYAYHFRERDDMS